MKEIVASLFSKENLTCHGFQLCECIVCANCAKILAKPCATERVPTYSRSLFAISSILSYGFMKCTQIGKDLNRDTCMNSKCLPNHNHGHRHAQWNISMQTFLKKMKSGSRQTFHTGSLTQDRLTSQTCGTGYAYRHLYMPLKTTFLILSRQLQKPEDTQQKIHTLWISGAVITSYSASHMNIGRETHSQ